MRTSERTLQMEIVVTAVRAASHVAQHIVGSIHVHKQRIIGQAVHVPARGDLPLL